MFRRPFVRWSVILAESSKRPVLHFVVGPTCSGKSAWALSEAIREGGEIVNADSVQIYKGLDIGAAKPSAEEFAKVPHHLFDLVKPDEAFTAGDYRRVALEVIEQRAAHVPLYIVGGSGFYLQALEHGMFEVGPISESIQTQVEEWRQLGQLFHELHWRDPASAEKIGANDFYRLQRALEVTLSAGRPFSEIQAEFRERRESGEGSLGQRFEIQKVGLSVDRHVLRGRIEKRTEKMLKMGLIEEVQGLVQKGFGSARALGAVGYKECMAFLAGELSRSDLAEAIVTSTMQLAKRQLTWFKRDPKISWISSAQLD